MRQSCETPRKQPTVGLSQEADTRAELPVATTRTASSGLLKGGLAVIWVHMRKLSVKSIALRKGEADTRDGQTLWH